MLVEVVSVADMDMVRERGNARIECCSSDVCCIIQFGTPDLAVIYISTFRVETVVSQIFYMTFSRLSSDS